jgi:hypothetical protein
MWVFSKDGFYSMVEDRDDPDTLIVRSRVEGDIEALWPDAEVIHTPDGDYAYRAALSRQEVAAAIAKEVLEISYSNYKDHITDKRRSPFYIQVWETMWRMQDALMVTPVRRGRRG